jgi:hypothetical protein
MTKQDGQEQTSATAAKHASTFAKMYQVLVLRSKSCENKRAVTNVPACPMPSLTIQLMAEAVAADSALPRPAAYNKNVEPTA